MHKTLDVIQGLWIGDHLSTMEQLSIASFLDHGHEYHLYVYQPVSNVPTGTSVKDAYEILPESMIFQYRKHPSYAGFANFFRYKLLLDVGGWWVDTDTVCLRPFDFASDYVFSSEPTKAGTDTPSTGFHQGSARQRDHGRRLGPLPGQGHRDAYLGRDRRPPARRIDRPT